METKSEGSAWLVKENREARGGAPQAGPKGEGPSRALDNQFPQRMKQRGAKDKP